MEATPDGATNTAPQVSLVQLDPNGSKYNNLNSIAQSNFIEVNRKRKYDNYSFERNKISHLISPALTTKNRFNNMREVLLNDNTVPQAPKTNLNLNKRIPSPKVQSITAKLESDKKEILDKIDNGGQCKFSIKPAGLFTKIFPDSIKE